MKNTDLQWIDLMDTTGRKSSLSFGGNGSTPGCLRVVGVLPHQTEFKIEEPGKMLDFLGKDYTEADKDRIGTTIAQLLNMPRDRDHKDRFSTLWGSKTPIGVFEVIRRLGREIEEGTKITLM